MLTAVLVIALQAAAPASHTAAAPEPVGTATAQEKMICKRVPRTGSIAAKEKICMTAAAWRRQGDDSRAIATTMQESSNR